MRAYLNGKGVVRRLFSCILMVTVMFANISLDHLEPVFAEENQMAETKYINDITITETARYTGNQGDSYLAPCTGFLEDLKGENHGIGLEAFLAHWDFQNEISWASATFNVNQEYRWLRGTLLQKKHPLYTSTDFNVTVYFYGDGNLISSYQMMPNNNPFEIEVPIENVKSLKILFKDAKAVSGGRMFGLLDCVVTNEEQTAKETVIPEDAITFNGHSYKIYNEYEGNNSAITFTRAKQYCELLGGHLVTITSKDENDFIVEMFNNSTIDLKNNYWLGMTLGTDTNHTATWITEETLTYENWTDGEPNNICSNEYCAHIYAKELWDGPLKKEQGEWNDICGDGGDNGGNNYSVNAIFDLKNFGFICEWDTDSEIIDRVKLYTTDGGKQFYSQLDYILKLPDTHNVSKEKMALILSDYFKKYGFTDIREANAYWNDASKATRAYEFLVNDGCYMAYALTEWLNKTPQGTITRGLLLADGWIFNNELKQYVELNTYITQETESIKNYKAMLLDFMGHQQESIEAYKYGKNIQKLMKESVKYTDKTFMEVYLDKIDKCKSLEGKNKIFNEYCNKMKEEYVENKDRFELHLSDYKGVSDILGVIGTGISIESDIFSDFEEIAAVESKIETLNAYSDFLQYIVDGEDVLPVGLVVAAKQLQDEMISPYKNIIFTIVGQLEGYAEKTEFGKKYKLSDFLKEKATNNSTVNAALKKTPFYEKLSKVPIGDALKVIELAAWANNCLIGIGTSVKEERYTEAYAYLGIYFSTLLEKSKIEFNKNPSEKNAWEFYNLYQLLYSIRVSGENSYIKIFSTKGFVKWIESVAKANWNYFGVKDKEAFIQDTFDFMENNCRFDIDDAKDITAAHYYAQKAIIGCPVDVEVYDKKGVLICTLQDGKEEDITTSEGRFICMYQPSSGQYEKIIYLNDADKYEIKAVGVDVGDVNIQLAKKDADQTQYYQMSGLPIMQDGQIVVNTKNLQYQVDVDNNGVDEYDAKLVEVNQNSSAIESIDITKTQMDMYVGQKEVLGAFAKPANVLYSDIEWNSSDEKIVEVDNGAISAKSEGNATVTASVGEVKASCSIVVTLRTQNGFVMNEILTKTYGDDSFQLSTTGGSGTGAVTYIVPSDNQVAVVSGDVVTIKGAGTVTIQAIKAADENYREAHAECTLTVLPKVLTPVLRGTVEKKYDGTTSVSGAAVNTLAISLGGILAEDLDKVSAEAATYEYADTAVGTDKAVIASGIRLQGEAVSNYVLSAETVNSKVGVIEKKDKVVQENFAIKEITAKTYGDGVFQLECEGGSGDGAVTYSVPEDNPVLAVSGSAVKILGAGTVTIKAVKEGNDDYLDAEAEYELTVRPRNVVPVVSGAVVKTYDGTTEIIGTSINTLHIVLPELLEGDQDKVSASALTYEFLDEKVGIDKAVRANVITLQGIGVQNYSLSTDSAIATVGAILEKSNGNQSGGENSNGATADDSSFGGTAGSGTAVQGKNSGTGIATGSGSSGNGTVTVTGSSSAGGTTVSGGSSGSTVGNSTGTSKGNKENGTGGKQADVPVEKLAGNLAIQIADGNVKLTYQINEDTNDTVTLYSASSKAEKIVIPATVKDISTGRVYRVVEIAKNAFQSQKKLTSVVINENVEKIGKNAFGGCKNLSDITVYGKNLKKVGKQAFKGTKKGAALKIEAQSMSAYEKLKKMFKKAGLKKPQCKYRIKAS